MFNNNYMFNNNILSTFHPMAGMNNFGGYGYGCSDAAMGFQTGMMLFNIAGQCINSYQASKQEEEQAVANNRNQLNDVNKKITENRAAHTTQVNKRSGFEGKINAANLEIKRLDGEISAKTPNVDMLKADYNSKLNEYGEATDDQKATLKTAVDEAFNKYNAAKKDLEKLEKDLKEQQDIVKENEPKVEACDTEIAKLDEEHTKLQAEKAKYEKLVRADIYEEAAGKKSRRTSDKEYASYWNADGTLKDGNYDKNDAHKAVNIYVGARDGSLAKYEAAEKLVALYDALPSDEQTSSLKFVAQEANKYVKNHTKPTAEV